MRFFMLSDLHFGENEDIQESKSQLKGLCEEIRRSSKPKETISLVILGDIINASNTEALKDVKDYLDYLQEELKDYIITFDFVPGNHDLPEGNIDIFDAFIAEYDVPCLFSKEGAYSRVYEGVNFIFADSMIRRDYTLPGELNINAIKGAVKPHIENILFCHHSFTHDFGGGHDTIENGRKILEILNEIGISFIFHGHTHRSDVTYFPEGIIEIGCGTISKDVHDMAGIPNQFTVGNIYNGRICSVDRFVVVNDGGRVFPQSRLYPEKQTFADPKTIGKEEYGKVSNYIQRKVLQHVSALGNEWEQYLSKDKRVTLFEALIENENVLLLSDAGSGKSFELENLAHKLYNTAYFPFLFQLRNYNGEVIEDILPCGYNMIPNYMVLLFDGYDELVSEERRKFKKQLNNFIGKYPEAHILISSRSNFCGSEKGNQSRSFDGFTIYNLCELSVMDIQDYMQLQDIDYTKFIEEARRKQIYDLLFNPFYLTRVCELYKKRGILPRKNQLMEVLVEVSFDVDDRKFDEELETDYLEFMEELEKLAFSMQLLHRNKLGERNEYQQLFSKEARQLIAHSGLLVKEGEDWRFTHNNFREYLVARYLSKCSMEEIISHIYGKGDIKPSWVNILGYLTGFDLEWDLCGWIADNVPSALVKFEPDRIDESARYEVFTKIFKHYEEKQLWFQNDLYTVEQLAAFSESDESLTFLLDRISNPVHSISQDIAIDILRHFSCLWGREKEVLECLLDCCKKYPTVQGNVCRIAIFTIYDLKLNNPDVTEKLLEIFKTNQNDHVRCGMYEYLISTNEQDEHVEYFLEGIQYVVRRYESTNIRIGNEHFNLVEGLKGMETEKSILAVLRWFSENLLSNFYSAKEVFAVLATKSVELYNNGAKNLYKGILKCCLRFLRKYENKYLKCCIEFFEKTGTLEQAIFAVADEFVDKEVCFHELLCYCKDAANIIIRAYIEGCFVHHKLFKQVVLDFVKDERFYIRCSELLAERGNIILPEFQPRIDYNAIWREGMQNLFDALFDKERFGKMVVNFLEESEDPELKVGELLDVKANIHWYSPSKLLRDTLYFSGNQEWLVEEFLEKVDYDRFVIVECRKLLERKNEIVISQEQRDRLKELIEIYLKNSLSTGEVLIRKNELGVSYFVESSIYLMQYFDFDLAEEVLVDLVSVPSYIFVRGEQGEKYEFLKRHLSREKIKAKLVEDLRLGDIHEILLRDHIEFCTEMRFEIATEKALLICREDPGDTLLQFSAIEYLYKLYGPQYICSKIIPYAVDNLLIEIALRYRDVSREKLRIVMEKEYQKAFTNSLIPHLIVLNSKIGLEGFLNEIKKTKSVQEDIRPLDSIKAIGMVNDPKLLPILGEIMSERFTPEFIDHDFYSLGEALIQAFINCGKNAPEFAIEIVEKHRISEGEIDNNRFCNYIIEEIYRNQRIDDDVPKTLEEVKVILRMV